VAAMTVIFEADALDRGGEPIHIDLGRGEHHLTDPGASRHDCPQFTGLGLWQAHLAPIERSSWR